MRIVIASLLAACWTGAEPEPVIPGEPAPTTKPAVPLEVTLERTQCFGTCPSYTVTIRADRTVMWNGDAYVTEVGARSSQVTHHDLAELDRAITRAHFFELDDNGHVPREPACVRTGNSTSCSFSSFTLCSDTSHAIITVRRGQRVHKVDDSHCSDTPAALIELEDAIDRIAGTGPWIGR